MSRACTPRRGGAIAVSVLLGALLALLMCSGATAAGIPAGSAPGFGARAADAGAVSPAAASAPASAAAGDAVAVSGLPAVSGAGPGASAAGPLAVSGLPAAVGDQQVPGCGKSPGGDSGTGPGTPARGSSSYELLHALHDARAASGPWGADDVLTAVTPDPGPPPLDPPSPIDLSVLRV